MSERIQGSMRVEWSIDKADLRLHGTDDLTHGRLWDLYNGLESILSRAIPPTITVYRYGYDNPPVRVTLKVVDPTGTIEIDDGPGNGTLADLRKELSR